MMNKIVAECSAPTGEIYKHLRAELDKAVLEHYIIKRGMSLVAASDELGMNRETLGRKAAIAGYEFINNKNRAVNPKGSSFTCIVAAKEEADFLAETTGRKHYVKEVGEYMTVTSHRKSYGESFVYSVGGRK